jgi:hypothetical protein
VVACPRNQLDLLIQNRHRPGREAKHCHMGHGLMDNRTGLAVAGWITKVTGMAEREAFEAMLKAKVKSACGRVTVGEDKAYGTADHVVTPHAASVISYVTQHNGETKTGRCHRSAIDPPPRLCDVAVPPGDNRVNVWLGKQHGTGRRVFSWLIGNDSADMIR